MILSIDTTSEFGSIALTQAGETVEEVLLHSPEGFSPILFQNVQALLDRHAIRVDAIECFAAASGPGSFTGVRVGLSAIKGLAEAADRSVVAVSNLRAMASFGSAPLRAVVLDARRGEVYGAVYNDRLEIVVAESVMKLPDWLQTLAALPAGGFEYIVSGAMMVGGTIPTICAPRALASAIGRIAALEFAAGRALDPAAIDANYVRRSDAELFWKNPVTRSPSK